MRIVYLSESIIPSRSANSVHVMKMCQAFARNGHDVTLIVPAKTNVEPNVSDVYAFYGVANCFAIRKLPWHRVKGKVQLYAMAASSATVTLSPDLVYGRFLSGCAMSALRGFTTAYESHAPVRDLGRIADWLFRRMLRARTYSGTVVISKALRVYYTNTYSIPENEMIVAHDGADPALADIEKLEWDSVSGALHVGYIGGLYPGKGMETISEMAPRCPWAHFHIVGGTTEDVAKWLGVLADAGNVTFYGFQPHGQTERFRASFDVVLAPYQEQVLGHGTRGEIGQWMSPLKLFEYMASGRAIVSSDLPVLREVLTHERNALLCPPRDIECWKHALERLRDDPALRRQLGARARADFEENYTWESRANAVLDKLRMHGHS